MFSETPHGVGDFGRYLGRALTTGLVASALSAAVLAPPARSTDHSLLAAQLVSPALVSRSVVVAARKNPVATRVNVAPAPTTPVVAAAADVDAESGYSDDEVEGINREEHEIPDGSLASLADDALEALEDRARDGNDRVIAARVDTTMRGVAKAVSDRVSVDADRLADIWVRTDTTRMRAVMTALSMVGVPYLWGGTTPRGFDCSGLMMYSWANSGVSLPRSSGSQIAATRARSINAIQPGDLAWKPGHIGMSLGIENIVVHAPRTGKRIDVVRYRKLNRFGAVR